LVGTTQSSPRVPPALGGRSLQHVLLAGLDIAHPGEPMLRHDDGTNAAAGAHAG